MVKIAFYKGKDQFLDRLIQWWTLGPYSHVEVVIGDDWYASSPYDGGVRVKKIQGDDEHWDFITLEGVDEQEIKDYFISRLGIKYDLLGAMGFVLRIIRNNKKRLFCSEIVAGALGIDEGWRFDPNTLAVTVRRMAG